MYRSGVILRVILGIFARLCVPFFPSQKVPTNFYAFCMSGMKLLTAFPKLFQYFVVFHLM